MTNLDGVGVNFSSVSGLSVNNQPRKTDVQKAVDKAAEETTLQGLSRKSPDEILSSMHAAGLQNLITPKITSMKSDPQLVNRISDFMVSFEEEVKKGLEVISKDFPTMEESQALEIAAKSALRGLDG